MNGPEQSIIRVFNINKRPIGSGFLVTPNLIITCAHVVQSASSSIDLGSEVLVDFPLTANKTQVIGKLIFFDLTRDIACLEVKEVPQMEIVPAAMIIADNLWGHEFRAFGFPNGHEEGVWSSGVLRGFTGQGWLQIEDIKESGYTIQPGYSGGPVWDHQLRSVIGIIVAAETERSTKAAFCVPARELVNIYPALKDHSSLLCPYRSLDIFTENDRDFFFGRERFVTKIVASLKREPRFLEILGPSGSGKSSAVRAGLLPALKEGRILGSESWHIMSIRPGAQPYGQLDNVGLRNSSSGLVASVSGWLSENPTKTRLVLFIDQFEELLIVTSNEIRKQFIEDLLGLLNSSLTVSVIITLRSDFSERYILEAPKLFYEWHQRGLIPVPPYLEDGELFEMISNPALKMGVEFENGLVERIIKDAIDIDRNNEQAESKVLPLLEFSLAQMWSIREGDKITHNDYQKIGGVSGGLSLWADKAYHDLSEPERKVARRILTELVNFGDVVLHSPNTKCIRSYDEIARNEIAQSVVQKLVQARLLVAGYDISLQQNTVEIIHEALIYKWGRLIQWIEEDREYLEIYGHFVESAKDWERFGKEDSLLYSDARLTRFVRAFETRKDESLGTLEDEFLQKSKHFHRILILNEGKSKINSSMHPDEIYKLTLQVAQQLISFDTFIISFTSKEENKYDVAFMFDQKSQKRVEPFLSKIQTDIFEAVIQSGDPMLVSLPRQEVTSNETEVQSFIVVPMLLDTQVVGVMSVQKRQPGSYSEEDMQILRLLSNETVTAIHNGRLFAETQSLAELMESRVVERTTQLQREQKNTETLLQILTEISSSLDLDRSLNRTLSILNDATGAEQGIIMLISGEDNLLHYRSGYGYISNNETIDQSGYAVRVGQGLAGWVVQNHQSVLISDLHQDNRWTETDFGYQDHHSAIAVPMSVGEDTIGLLMVLHRARNFFSPELLRLISGIAGQVSVAVNNARLYELIRDQAERLGLMLRKEQVEAGRTQAILEAVADGVLVTDMENRISFVNSSTTRILGLEEDQMLGNSLESFAGIFGNSSISWIKTIHHWSERPSSYNAGEMYAEQLELENERIVLVHLAPVILTNDFLGTVSIFRDITREVEVDRLKSEFVATISNDLRTPVNSMHEHLDALLKGVEGALNNGQLHHVSMIKKNVEQLGAQINELLDISNLESGRVFVSFEPINLGNISQSIIESYRIRAKDAGKPLTIKCEFQSNLPDVYGDPDRIVQIMKCLIENAYLYTPANGKIEILIKQRDSQHEVLVEVVDNGIGIPSENQSRIFERFYRGDNPLVLSSPGTGLGLSIAKQLVEMHNGQIWMKSSGIPGEGCVFSFTLPVNNPE